MIKKKYYCKECKKYHILQTDIGKKHLHNIDTTKPKLLTNDEINELYKIEDSVDYKLFNKYSYKWLGGIDPAGRDMAIHIANSNRKLKQYLHFRQFGKKIPRKVTLYRVGGIENNYKWSSFWTNYGAAKAYQKRFGVNRIYKYEGTINNIIPSLSGSEEVFAKNVKKI
ncbi:hypothetical protein LCGC14_1017320 [marine sediment metagenome]|uniref:Uncharacterized protein n=1 Tax=marine sediment metagenome TaxID=412755 RepID=A0A0F9R4K0_9ZZZZ